MFSVRAPRVSGILLSSVLLGPLCGCGSGGGTSGSLDPSEAGSPDAAQVIVVELDAQGSAETSVDGAAAPLGDAGLPVEDSGDTGSVPGEGGKDADLQDGSLSFDSAVLADALAPEAGGSTCSSGTLSCNGVCVPNGVHDCGTCGHDCTNLPHVTGSTGCSASGSCVIGSTSCAPGWADCDGNPEDGCETDITQPGHCGSCTTVCPTGDPVCSGSGSSYSCVTGCPSAEPELCSGSCVDTSSNVSDCGACGHACSTSISGAHAVCTSSMCGFECNAGYAACPAATPTACDDLANDVKNCGACGRACPGPTSGSGTGSAACVPSGCTVDCASGLTACPAAPALATTCVDAENDDANCGGCGVACHGGEHCVSGTCACTNGQHLCGSPATCVGETVSACGPSCEVCSGPANATAACNGSACAWACNAGFTGCPLANPTACDALGSDSNNCGACGHVCTGGQTCQAGVCACAAGEAFCDGTCLNDLTDPDNCGACGHSCLGGACSAGQCQPFLMATGVEGPITLDANNIYFASQTEVYSCAKTGCTAPTALYAPGKPPVSGLLYDSSNGGRLFVSEEQANLVGMINIYGAQAGASPVTQPEGLVSDANNVYVAAYTGTIVAGAKGINNFLSATTIAAGLPGPAVSVALDAQASVVYGAIESNAGAIVRAATTSTGAFETFIANQPNPVSVVVAAGNVYWADLGTESNNYDDGAAYMCPAGASCTQPTLLGRGNYCATMTADSSYIYFVCSAELYRCPLTGCGQGGPVTLAGADPLSRATLTNDATALYWTAEYFGLTNAALVKLAK